MIAVAVIVGLFFVIGIAVGVITMIAISVLRREGRAAPDTWTGYGSDRPDEPPEPGGDTSETEPPPWWQSRR